MTGFNSEKYLIEQAKHIKEKINSFEKLYLEFGGKLFDDYHAARVLPGFEPDSKIKMLAELKDITEIIICINSKDIERKKMRADYGITYDEEVLRLIDEFTNLGLLVNSVVITLYKDEVGAIKLKHKLEQHGIKTYIHTPTKGYPTDVDVIVSEEGYGANPYIETTRKLIVVTAPGPASGKFATCLSQLYHEHKKGVKAGYAKYETFPVWNLPLKHPVNVAYEAATADLKDIIMIDSFHLDTYGEATVNYNRDLEVFPVVKSILSKIMGENIYASPTDMGVNKIGFCINDESIVKQASRQEIIRRYYKELCSEKSNNKTNETSSRIKVLMNELEISKSDRPCIDVALEKEKLTNCPVIALELPNGKIITGKRTELLSPASSVILNAIKELTNIPDEVYLLSPSILEPILKLKPKKTGNRHQLLSLQEVLIALSICSVTNPIVEKAISKLSKLKGLEAHSTFMVYNGDLDALKQLGINLTCEPIFYSNNLFLQD